MLAEIVSYSSTTNAKILLEECARLTVMPIAGFEAPLGVDMDARPNEKLAANGPAFSIYQHVLILRTPLLRTLLYAEGLSPEGAFEGLSQSEVSAKLVSIAQSAAQGHAGRRASTVEDEECLSQLLDSVLLLYGSHSSNCDLLEPKYRILSLFVTTISVYKSEELKTMILKTLEYMCLGFVSQSVPELSLQSLSLTFLALCDSGLDIALEHISSQVASPARLDSVLLDAERLASTLIKLLQFDRSLSETLCACGLMEGALAAIFTRLARDGPALAAVVTGSSPLVSFAARALQLCALSCSVLIELLKSSSANVKQYRTLGIQVLSLA